MSGRAPSPRVAAALALAAVLVLALAARAIVTAAIGAQVERRAKARGLDASWQAMQFDFPGRIRITRLALTDARSDTVMWADSIEARLAFSSLLALRPRPQRLSVHHARFRAGSAAADPDTTLAEPLPRERAAGRSAALRRAAERMVDMLLAPARRLPALNLADVTVETGRADALLRGVRFAALDLTSDRGSVRLLARGSLLAEGDTPFELSVDYARDDRIAGGARFVVPSPRGGKGEELRLAIDGSVTQDRDAGTVRLGDSTRVYLGRLPLLLSGSVERSGPRIAFDLHAEDLAPETVQESLPEVVLGPLADLSLAGTFDYRLALDLDLARPDSVELSAKVTPHGLRIDHARSRLDLGIDQPFTAIVHLPRDRRVPRELYPGHPHFRPLDAIDTLIVNAVVTNEDGGFFRHRGFNLDAVKSAIATNIEAGAFRRGAGTITMQLARNLYLGHQRTLSRKAQEVVLAWVLEHLTGVGKRRLLEIYLNIIEWGPGIHGADEATQYYFGHDADRATISEALFLSTVIPAPTKWRWRFGPDGELKPYARAQMHFIGRAMIAKGWLAPELLPPADSLRVELRGPARAVVSPPPDSVIVEPKQDANEGA